MASELQLHAKTKIIETKARELLQRIQRDYENGTIKSHTEYLYQIFHGLQGFYKSIGQPTMQQRFAWGPPVSNDYNTMMKEIHHDIVTLFGEAEFLSGSINESFRQVEIDRQNLSNRLKQIEDSMTELKAKRTQQSNQVIYRDSFIDQKSYDKEMIEGTPVNVWTREGILTLQPKSAESYTDGVTIRITEGNGFPGNTHQIRSISGTLKFVGEENLHISLAEILDRNLDTWFEYELFDVRDEVLAETVGLGFEYKEGIKWITEDIGTLRLVLEMELPYAKPVNWFSIAPFLPNDKGVSSAQIKSIKISDGKGKVTEIIEQDQVFNEEKVYLFTQQNCKKITIQIEQSNAYDTVIGHLFYKEANEGSANYLNTSHYDLGRRIDGEMPSIDNLGVRYNPETRMIHQPEMVHGEIITNTEERKQALFTAPLTNTNVLAGFEALPAWRYMIGVRDAAASHYEFVDQGEYRSVNFYSVQPIQSISLFVDEYIPKEFEEGQWITYDISIDDGQNWNPIIPRQSRKQGKLLYLINTNTPQEGRIQEFGYIDTNMPVHQVRLRIRLARPTRIVGAQYYTPIIRHYQLEVVTEGVEE